MLTAEESFTKNGRYRTRQNAPLPLPRRPMIELESRTELRFKTDAGYEVLPLYRIQDQRYSIYWQTPLKAL